MIPNETLHKVARRVALAWKRKGLNYPVEDLYQDAVELMHRAMRRYDPENHTGSGLEAYLYKSAVNKVGDRMTRAVQPASARSNNDIPQLRKLVTVRVGTYTRGQTTTPEYSHLVWLTQVRERMFQVTKDLGPTPLMIALGVCDVQDVAKDKTHANELYQAVRRVKQLLLRDRKLYTMFQEITCLA